MKKIYRLSSEENYQSVVAIDAKKIQKCVMNLNRTPLLDFWIPLKFEYHASTAEAIYRPDIYRVHGSIAFLENFKDAIFPTNSEELEFLPIVVSNDRWLLVNCLKTTSKYDEEKSSLFRDVSSEYSGDVEEEQLLVHLAKMNYRDKKNFDFFKKGKGEIVLINKLTIYDSSLDQSCLFTISDSNRSCVFALPQFVERIRILKLHGLEFTEVGDLWDDAY